MFYWLMFCISSSSMEIRHNYSFCDTSLSSVCLEIYKNSRISCLKVYSSLILYLYHWLSLLKVKSCILTNGEGWYVLNPTQQSYVTVSSVSLDLILPFSIFVKIKNCFHIQFLMSVALKLWIKISLTPKDWRFFLRLAMIFFVSWIFVILFL